MRESLLEACFPESKSVSQLKRAEIPCVVIWIHFEFFFSSLTFFWEGGGWLYPAMFCFHGSLLMVFRGSRGPYGVSGIKPGTACKANALCRNSAPAQTFLFWLGVGGRNQTRDSDMWCIHCTTEQHLQPLSSLEHSFDSAQWWDICLAHSGPRTDSGSSHSISYVIPRVYQGWLLSEEPGVTQAAYPRVPSPWSWTYLLTALVDTVGPNSVLMAHYMQIIRQSLCLRGI